MMTTNENSSGKWRRSTTTLRWAKKNLKSGLTVGKSGKWSTKKVLSASVTTQIGKLQKHVAILGVSERLPDCVWAASVPVPVE